MRIPWHLVPNFFSIDRRIIWSCLPADSRSRYPSDDHERKTFDLGTIDSRFLVFHRSPLSPVAVRASRQDIFDSRGFARERRGNHRPIWWEIKPGNIRFFASDRSWTSRVRSRSSPAGRTESASAPPENSYEMERR